VAYSHAPTQHTTHNTQHTTHNTQHTTHTTHNTQHTTAPVSPPPSPISCIVAYNNHASRRIIMHAPHRTAPHRTAPRRTTPHRHNTRTRTRKRTRTRTTHNTQHTTHVFLRFRTCLRSATCLLLLRCSQQFSVLFIASISPFSLKLDCEENLCHQCWLCKRGAVYTRGLTSPTSTDLSSARISIRHQNWNILVEICPELCGCKHIISGKVLIFSSKLGHLAPYFTPFTHLVSSPGPNFRATPPQGKQNTDSKNGSCHLPCTRPFNIILLSLTTTEIISINHNI